jgi:hypothetical protein
MPAQHDKQTTAPSWPDGQPPASVLDFQTCLAAAGIMPLAESEALLKKLPPEARLDTPKSLAAELIKAGKLTKFQAAGLLQGKLKYLLFGEYLVLDKIGAGGMGQVLKAEHRRMKRVVALKVMSGSEMQRPDAVRRSASTSRGPPDSSNIVTAFDANERTASIFWSWSMSMGTICERDSQKGRCRRTRRGVHPASGPGPGHAHARAWSSRH